ncbi:putative peptidyl-tRNA hydrolase PTRHD1 [Grammomys surdaster]|uniref:putative peptidyl-tRNA hydrolase PTRHD1 n=1 Tax=Grammomys surdaster TaxID=491861 RepID=UPI00109F77DF|nr:putative peptidyl-tRNA hydrolase PTRHD1 [Grammomys surdaster]
MEPGLCVPEFWVVPGSANICAQGLGAKRATEFAIGECLRSENLYRSAKSLHGRGWSEKVCKLLRADWIVGTRKIRPSIRMIRKMAGSGVEPQILVQYLVLRKDLSQAPFSWPTGALVAQACHAATAALHLHRDHPHTAAYLRELGRMRKVVLEPADEATLKELAETLQQKSIDHTLWLEQPENIATCIALRPYSKEEVSQYLKKFRLFK